ncbi:hypothetical protein HYW82_03910, partial [Candidatus Peregrinibacteria bacterium]|nr:hypothetical protein [Candidatus Peregrinibacteria bacterium]
MADDNTQQNKANQQLNAQNKPKKPENEREDYAKKMWQHIEKKTGSQTALSGLREGI